MARLAGYRRTVANVKVWLDPAPGETEADLIAQAHREADETPGPGGSTFGYRIDPQADGLALVQIFTD